MTRGVSPTLLERNGQDGFGSVPRASSILTLTGADVAAGAEFLETVPEGKVWELVSVSVLLVQGITNTPQPILVVDDGAAVIAEVFGATAAQAVSTTCRYTWGDNLPASGLVGTGVNVHATAPLPSGLVLPAGYRVGSRTLGIAATSNYGAPVLHVVEYGA